MKDAEYFYNEILRAKNNSNPGYGGTVTPAMEIFANIVIKEEKKAYQNALEKMLNSENEDIREYGVDLCLGFFVFREVLHRSSN